MHMNFSLAILLNLKLQCVWCKENGIETGMENIILSMHAPY